MSAGADPFRHHPELREKIAPASRSFFRDLDLDALDQKLMAAGHPADWRTPCAEREANRKTWLRGHDGGDLWVFGYGSLMWDPSVVFSEVRRAETPEYARSFCLWDDGGRGTREHPGLMLALDAGAGCAGLAFRIPADQVEHETFVLFRREMIMNTYQPHWIPCDTRQGPITAMTFVANHAHPDIRPGIPLEAQARMIAGAEGILGPNLDYLENTMRHLKLLEVEDGYIRRLYATTTALTA